MAFTSTFDVDTAGRSPPDWGFVESSVLGAGFAVVSFDAVRWGIFRMSLYFACGGGGALVPSFRSVMISISFAHISKGMFQSIGIA
jgi:hypothetical protein